MNIIISCVINQLTIKYIKLTPCMLCMSILPCTQGIMLCATNFFTCTQGGLI